MNIHGLEFPDHLHYAPALGLWMPAGTLHSGSAVAGTWCRAAFGI